MIGNGSIGKLLFYLLFGYGPFFSFQFFLFLLDKLFAISVLCGLQSLTKFIVGHIKIQFLFMFNFVKIMEYFYQKKNTIYIITILKLKIIALLLDLIIFG